MVIVVMVGALGPSRARSGTPLRYVSPLAFASD